MLIPKLRVPLWLYMEFDMRAIEKFELVKWLVFQIKGKSNNDKFFLITRVVEQDGTHSSLNFSKS